MTSNGTPWSQQRLEVRFPVHTVWELTLSNDETVEGSIYCTDEASQTIVLQKALTHTTLASEVRMIQASCVTKAVQKNNGEDSEMGPLPKIQSKVLEEREKRALRLAEDSLRHINQKVGCSPAGWLASSALWLVMDTSHCHSLSSSSL